MWDIVPRHWRGFWAYLTELGSLNDDVLKVLSDNTTIPQYYFHFLLLYIVMWHLTWFTRILLLLTICPHWAQLILNTKWELTSWWKQSWRIYLWRPLTPRGQWKFWTNIWEYKCTIKRKWATCGSWNQWLSKIFSHMRCKFWLWRRFMDTNGDATKKLIVRSKDNVKKLLPQEWLWPMKNWD